MATSPHVQQEKAGSVLDLNLSLGGLYSQLPRSSCQITCSDEDVPSLLPSSAIYPMFDILSSPTLLDNPHTLLDNPHQCVDTMQHTQHRDPLDAVKRRRCLHSRDINPQRKRARAGESDQDQTHFCNSSGNLSSKANYSKPTGYPEHFSLQSDTNIRGHAVHLTPSNQSVHCKLSDMKQATVTDEVPCGFATSRKGALHRPSQLEIPLPLNSWRHSATVSCGSCTHTQTSPPNTQSSHSPIQNASCPLTSSLSLSMAPSLPLADTKTGSTGIINHMHPTKRKSSILDEEGKICRSNSTESENGDNPDKESTTWNKVAVLEAPRSRCGSNSDMIGSMDPLAAKSIITSSMMYMHPSAMLPVQGPFSVPIQWGFTLPYAAQYTSQMVPHHTCFPWIPFVPDSASGMRPRIPAVSCNEGKLQDNQGTPSSEDALTALPTSKIEEVQDASQITELPPAVVHKAMPRSVSEVSTSASSLRPSCSTSPMVNCSSDVCTSPWQPLASATSQVTNLSSDSCKQVDPAKEDSGLNVSNSSPTRGRLKSVLCPPKSMKAGSVENKLCGQSKDGEISGRKAMKTVRFCCDERELVKSSSSVNQTHKSSSLFSRSNRVCKSANHVGNSYKSQLIRKLQTIREEYLCNRVRRNGITLNRSTQECEQEEESANSRITSESSDQDESAIIKVVGGARELEGKSATSLARVSTTCAGPNAKTIHGVVYISESKQACLVCSCHGKHMSPSEFVQHSGSTDLRNPEKSIVVTGFYV